MSYVGDRKRVAKQRQMTARQRVRASIRADRKRWSRCWWTRPFGHVYEDRRCVGCGVLKPTLVHVP